MKEYVAAEEIKKFNEDRIKSIQKNFNTCEISIGNKTISALFPSRANSELILDKKKKQETKNLFNNLLIDVFGTGDLGLVESTFSIFESNKKRYVPDFSFKCEGLDVVKSSILGGNVDIFRIACNKVKISNIEDKDSALNFATEKEIFDISEALLKLKNDRIEQEKEEERRKRKSDQNRVKRARVKASRQNKKISDNSTEEIEIIDSKLPQIETLPLENDFDLGEVISKITEEQKNKSQIQSEKESGRTLLEQYALESKTIRTETDMLLDQCLEEFGWTEKSDNIDEKKLINRFFELTLKSGEDKKIKPKESNFFENKSDIESRLSPNAAVFTPKISAYFEAQKNTKPSVKTLS